MSILTAESSIVAIWGGGFGRPIGMQSRDGAVHKFLVRKLHRTAQFYPHTALHRKKFVNLIHRTANPTASQNMMVNSIGGQVNAKR